MTYPLGGVKFSGVPRKLRIQYGGAIYHVLNRGDRREDIFYDADDRRLFLTTLGETCAKTGWEVHAYCLMRNHFHLIVETPRPNLVAGMQWLMGTYTTRFNRRHRLNGHLFSGRYKAQLVDGSGNGYLRTVCDYVHLNPLRAKLLPAKKRLRTYGWSSYPLYLTAAAKRPLWLRVDRLLGECGLKDTMGGRRRLEERMEKRCREESGDGPWKPLRRGWCVGEEEFRKELLEKIADDRGQTDRGEEVQECESLKAERLVVQMLKAARWTEEDLAGNRKGHAVKVMIARRLRRDTTAGWKWIAVRLKMGHWRSAANAVRAAANTSP